MNTPAIYEQALHIARAKGWNGNGFWKQDKYGATPHIRTQEFAGYFFLDDLDFVAFNKSSDPENFIEDYIKENYKDSKSTS